MPYKYIGRTHSFKGKTLWEIVGSLKNFGVGRLVVRNSVAERYPEPSFYRILKVETLPQPKEQSLDNLRKVKVLVEKTFRGVTSPKPVCIESTSYKTDYCLIPKDEEQNYSQYQPTVINEKIFPSIMELPPLMKEVFIREMKIKGEPVVEPVMDIVYNDKKRRIAKEGEKPTVEIKIGLGKPAALSLYKGIKLE